MAKGISFTFRASPKVKRKGIHAKTKSRTKSGKQYKKKIQWARKIKNTVNVLSGNLVNAVKLLKLLKLLNI